MKRFQNPSSRSSKTLHPFDKIKKGSRCKNNCNIKCSSVTISAFSEDKFVKYEYYQIENFSKGK